MFWSNVLFNGFFFFSISLGALFFMALQFATEASWSVLIRRVLEAIAKFLPYAALALVIVFIASSFNLNSIYPWMMKGVSNPDSPAFDPVIAEKSAYLNIPFFWLRTLIYLAVFIGFSMAFRKRSLAQDKTENKAEILDIHYKNYKRSALFLVFFAVFSSTLSWDWVMSVDAHWFSTLFGWYVLSGMWLMGVTTALLIILYLKSKGYLPLINKNHLHDLGKWVFALSFLWTYLWFSQYMLIWYTNMAEEIIYFLNRYENYKFLFFFTLAINFIIPMLILMSRDSKRNRKYLAIIASIVVFGHWLDAYLLFIPGILFEHGHLSWEHFGVFFGFFGLFIYVVFTALSKAPLVPVHDPYKDESLHHEI